MASQVIDELIVTLGLDASQFTAGQKRAAASMLETKNTVTSSVSEMGSSLTSFAGKMAAFFLGFEGLKGVISLVKETAYQFKQMGITAELLGTSLRDVRTMGEFSQLAGAGPTGISNWIMGQRMGLSQRVLGGIPSWALPAMVGLNPLTAWQGSQQDVWKRFQGAINSTSLQGLMLGAPSEKVAKEMFGQMLGMPSQLAAEAANPQHAMEDLTRAIKTNKGVTDSMAESGRRAANAMINLHTEVENAATLGFGVLTGITNLTAKAFEGLLKVLNEILNSPLVKWIESSSGTAGKAASWWWNNVEKPTVQNEEALASSVFDWVGNAYAKMSGNVSMLRAANMGAIPNWAANWASLVGAGGQGGTNNSFAIGNISVNTAATDAAGIAAAMKDAITRKFQVSQGDGGMH